MRLRAVAMVAIVCAIAPCQVARSAWRPAVDAGRGAYPHVASQAGAEMAAWTNGFRLSWSSEQLGPRLSPFARVAQVGYDAEWDANARGDLLAVASEGEHVRAVALDATGTRAELRGGGASPYIYSADVGADGTMAMAWTALDRDDWLLGRYWLSVRPPGGAFTRPVVVGSRSARVSELALAVEQDGRVTLAATRRGPRAATVLYGEATAAAPAPVLTPVADVLPYQNGLAVLPGPRIAVQVQTKAGRPRVVTFGRATDGAWIRQGFAGWLPRTGALAALPGGETLLLHQTPLRDRGSSGDLVVRRAGAAQPFSAAELIDRKRGCLSATTCASSPAPAGTR